MRPCDPDRLRLLAEDRLPPDEVVGTRRALAALRRVPEALDDLAGSEPWIEAVRQYLGRRSDRAV